MHEHKINANIPARPLTMFHVKLLKVFLINQLSIVYGTERLSHSTNYVFVTNWSWFFHGLRFSQKNQ